MRIVTPPATVAVVRAPLLMRVRTASMLQARTAWLSAVSPVELRMPIAAPLPSSRSTLAA